MATDLRAHLFAALSTVAPVSNVDIGDPGDRATWRVGFTDAATNAEKQAAAVLIASYADVPDSVTRRQGRLALSAAGLLDRVEAMVAASARAPQIWYADADTWERSDPILARLAGALGLTSDQVDALVRQAAAL